MIKNRLNDLNSKKEVEKFNDMSDHTQTNIITLTRHIVTAQNKIKEASGDLTLLLAAIQVGCKFVEACVRKASLVYLTGLAGMQNVQGEDVKKLDVLANEIFIQNLKASGKCKVLVSEEDDEAIFIEGEAGCKYCVVFDPLDGSSNIDAGVNVGTIFGIYLVKPGSNGTVEDVLRPGNEMVAAGYCMYGSSCNLVLTTGQGVNGFTLDPAIGEFVLTHPDIKIPSRGKIYSVNEGNAAYWDKPCTEYFNSIKFPESSKKPYSSRYIGSMVADVHRTLLYGGIFAYPGDKKSPNGKLRILYECFPMAMIMEQAGGKATTGDLRMLDFVPKGIHDRSPIFMGSKEDVEDIEAFYKKFSN
ncbi:inositol phosphatase [Neoconidiobolus thromboides FSU 785]|nr:inositol phosphatase [Neoconidiobolus thromboides FSU 785]